MKECTKGWTDRCAHAMGRSCQCACGGENHGRLAPRKPGEQMDAFDGEEPRRVTPAAVFQPRGEGRRAFLANAPTEGEVVLERTAGGATRIQGVDHRLVHHSPTGLEWGYGGSGPADLALNVLGLFLAPPEAFRLHQAFKWDHVATLPREGGRISYQVVREWIQAAWDAEEPRPAVAEEVV